MMSCINYQNNLHRFIIFKNILSGINFHKIKNEIYFVYEITHAFFSTI